MLFFLSCAMYKKNEKYCAKLKISNSLHNSILFLMIFQSFSYKWWQKIYTMYYNETILMISYKQAHYVFDLFSDLFKWKHGNPHVSADYGESPLLHFTFLNPIGYFRNKLQCYKVYQDINLVGCMFKSCEAFLVIKC